MATAMLMKWGGVTQEQYDAVIENLDLDNNPADGGLFHIAGFTGDGLRVVDVWDSQQDFERFQQERLMSAVQAAGMDGEPQVEFFEIHNVWAPRADELVKQGASAQPA
jgi:hypothetical protein